MVEASVVENPLVGNNADGAGPAPAALGRWTESFRLERSRRVLGARRLAASPIARCLPALLVALDWFGAPETLVGALPPPETPLSVGDLERALAGIGFVTRSWPGALPSVSALPPGSVVVHRDGCHVVLGALDDVVWWHDGDAAIPAPVHLPRGATVLVITRDHEHRSVDAPRPGFVASALSGIGRPLRAAVIGSLIINLMALAVSLFTMVVYDHVIPAGARTTLTALTVGACLVASGAWAARLARARMVARLGAWRGLEAAVVAFRKTLGLSPEVLSRGGADVHVGRIRAVETIRVGLTGGGGEVIDYPFVLIFLVVIAGLGGWVVLAPIVGLIVMALVAVPVSWMIGTRDRAAANAQALARAEMRVAIEGAVALRHAGGLGHWMARLTEIAEHAADTARRRAIIRSFGRATAQVIAMFTALGTLALGIALVLNGEMTAGGLIATMMLIWRVTTPAQRAFAGMDRLRGAKDAVRQVDALIGRRRRDARAQGGAGLRRRYPGRHRGQAVRPLRRNRRTGVDRRVVRGAGRSPFGDHRPQWVRQERARAMSYRFGDAVGRKRSDQRSGHPPVRSRHLPLGYRLPAPGTRRVSAFHRRTHPSRPTGMGGRGDRGGAGFDPGCRLVADSRRAPGRRRVGACDGPGRAGRGGRSGERGDGAGPGGGRRSAVLDPGQSGGRSRPRSRRRADAGSRSDARAIHHDLDHPSTGTDQKRRSGVGVGPRRDRPFRSGEIGLTTIRFPTPWAPDARIRMRCP